MTEQTPPGWYYAQGDPAGTQRYWDGANWVGEPQVVGDTPAAAATPAAAPTPAAAATPVAGAAPAAMVAGGRQRAEWATRASAYVIDMAIVFVPIIAVVIIGFIVGAVSSTLGGIVAVLGYLAVAAAAIYLMYWVPGTTGQTPGKRIMGYEIVNKETGQYLGGGGYLVRALIGGWINGLPCYLGWLWPLWDANKETFADKIFKSAAVTREKGSLLPLFPDGKPF